jgi:lipoate-protein ligase B
MPEEKLKECLLCRLGRISYDDAINLQQRMLQARFEEKTGDVLLLLEHPPTITLGKFAKPENVLAPVELLKERGIAVHASDRGGDVTFHCPGQMVMHPIMDLRKRPGVLRGYITDLEETALRVLQDYGIAAEREEHPGLWVAGKQIGAIGLRFSHGISMHGLSLNVNPDLESFKVINLCGLPGVAPTSIAKETGRQDIAMQEVEERLMHSFAEVFNVELLPVSRKQLEGGTFEPETARMV